MIHNDHDYSYIKEFIEQLKEKNIDLNCDIAIDDLDQDVTELIKTQQTYQKEKEFSEVLLNTSQNIIVVTKDDEIYKTNDTFFKYFDYKNLEEFKSEHKCICDLAQKRDGYIQKTIDGEKWYEVINKNKEVKYKMLFNTKDSKESMFFVTSEIITVDNETFIVSSFSDITEVEEARIKAESAEKLMSIFLANMSHEIRTPLNGIIGFSSLLSNTKLNKTQKKYSEIIHSSSNSLLTIINSILDFSKLKSKNIELEIIPINIIQVLEDIYNLLKFSTDRKSLKFKLELDKNLQPNVKFDPTRLRQVITNLASNAIKFTDPGGSVKISAEVLDSKEDSQRVRISVTDTGIGISKNNIDKIFSAFTQENISTTRKYGGTGLGLSISKELVNIFNSELKVESEVDKGSKFFFDLELEHSNDEAQNHLHEDVQNNNKIEKINTKELSILIVDDSNINVVLMKSILEHYNVLTDAAYDGKEAVEKVKNSSFDIIFMDVNMPVMDGLEATTLIREFNQDVKIIALTSNIIEGDKKRFMDVGINDYLTKPIDVHELERVLIGFNFNEIFNATKESLFLDEKTIFKLYNSIIEVSAEVVESIEDGIKNSNYLTLEHAAHKLKGAAGSLKLDYMYDITIQMEKDAKEHKEIDYSIYLDIIKKYFEFFAECLKKNSTNN